MSGPADMQDLAGALRWALRRIETAGLGQGEYFDRADKLLAQHDRVTAPDAVQAFRGLYAAAEHANRVALREFGRGVVDTVALHRAECTLRAVECL